MCSRARAFDSHVFRRLVSSQVELDALFETVLLCKRARDAVIKPLQAAACPCYAVVFTLV